VLGRLGCDRRGLCEFHLEDTEVAAQRLTVRETLGEVIEVRWITFSTSC